MRSHRRLSQHHIGNPVEAIIITSATIIVPAVFVEVEGEQSGDRAVTSVVRVDSKTLEVAVVCRRSTTPCAGGVHVDAAFAIHCQCRRRSEDFRVVEILKQEFHLKEELEALVELCKREAAPLLLDAILPQAGCVASLPADANARHHAALETCCLLRPACQCSCSPQLLSPAALARTHSDGAGSAAATQCRSSTGKSSSIVISRERQTLGRQARPRDPWTSGSADSRTLVDKFEGE
eukprot:scaffold10899_cov70-Phaeocystis_antarctica.AAC.5